jgi:hypothetical protein
MSVRTSSRRSGLDSIGQVHYSRSFFRITALVALNNHFYFGLPDVLLEAAAMSVATAL